MWSVFTGSGFSKDSRVEMSDEGQEILNAETFGHCANAEGTSAPKSIEKVKKTRYWIRSKIMPYDLFNRGHLTKL